MGVPAVPRLAEHHRIIPSPRLIAVDFDDRRAEDVGRPIGDQPLMTVSLQQFADRSTPAKFPEPAYFIYAILGPQRRRPRAVPRIGKRAVASDEAPDRLPILQRRKPRQDIPADQILITLHCGNG